MASFQMTLYSPGMELSNITFHGSWAMTRDFSQNISRVSRQPPVFYICSEDFKPLGIRAPLFGAACFVLVYAIPGKITRLITNLTRTHIIHILFLFPFRKRKSRWYDSFLLYIPKRDQSCHSLPSLTFIVLPCLITFVLQVSS